ncbi:MAG TPA: hypothetical protein VMT32_18760 [Bryobacteraceae bacterium]|nr:hypothetical protein [Bryobacteraceae bacterium]
MPPAFPETDFRAFGVAASTFFRHLMSDEALFDPEEKKRHFDWSWLAVRSRYRICAECNDGFKGLLANASDMWRADSGDEELTYRLERCIYVFFMSELSALESFGFCLYFLGNALRPADFPHFNKPGKITLEATSKAFTTTFPQEAITRHLADLLQNPEYTTISKFRNIMAHRAGGRRSIRAWNETQPDGTTIRKQEDTWHLPGSTQKLTFGDEMLQRYLDEMAAMLTTLAKAAHEFAENNQPAKAKP